MVGSIAEHLIGSSRFGYTSGENTNAVYAIHINAGFKVSQINQRGQKLFRQTTNSN